MLLTEDQRLLIKTTESESRAYLSIYKPTVLFACRVNMATPKVGDSEITFDTVTTGAYTDVFKWATVFIGTAAGKNDVSTIWARSCTATKLTVGMNSIDWKDNLYITVLNFVDMWNRPFSFYLSGDQIVYEIDGDTAFAAVDEGLGTFVNVGGNQAVFTGGKVYWDASESLNVSGDSVTYTWVFEGGTPSTYSGETPGDVTYNTPGHYKTKVVATSSSGYVNIGYRYVSVYDRFGVNSPKTLVISNDFSGSREEGGWVANVLIGQDSLADVQIGYPAVVFAEHNFGGQDSDLFKILFSGYVVGKSGTYDFVSKTAEFMLGTGNERMLLRPMTSISVDSSSSASGWHEITEMTVKRFLYYYLNYFTTSLACFDIRVGSGFDTPVRYFETDINSIYENVFDIVNKSRGGLPVFDRQGTMWVELGADILDSFCSTVPTTFALEDDDFLGDVNIEETNPNMGNLQIGGFAGDTPLLSESPDTNYVYYVGDGANRQGFAVDTQEELNTICGNIYAHANAKYQNVDISLFGIYLNFDIAPMTCIPVSVSESKNNLGLSWNKKSFYCTEATLEFSPDSLSILYSVSLHEITQGFAGETLLIPPPAIEGETPIELPGFEDIDWPALTPIGTFFPPYINPVEPVIPGTGCPTDAPANGPYSMNIYGTLDSTTFIKAGYFDVVVRTSGHDNKTTYVIKGTFQKLKTGEDPEDPTSYEETLEDDWYDVFAYNSAGTLIATGVHDSVTNPKVRTGVLNAIAASQIHKIEISMGSNQLFRPSITYDDGIWGDQGSKLPGDTYKTGNLGSGIWVRAENIKYGGDYGEGAGGKRTIGVWSYIYLGENHEYGGGTFLVKQFSWFRFTPLSGGGLGVVGGIEGRGSKAYNTAPTWVDDFEDVPGPTGVLISEEHTYLLTLGEFEDLYFSTNDWGEIEGTNGEYLSECLLHQVEIKRASNYRILISQVNIWNVCPRVS
jgi:hypothetical protein